MTSVSPNGTKSPCTSAGSKQGDTPGAVGQVTVTWDYLENVLDLEPHGPLPSQIYWRRRGLALGIAALVVAIVVGVAIAVFSNSDSATTAKTDTSQAPQPEDKTPVLPPPLQVLRPPRLQLRPWSRRRYCKPALTARTRTWR